MDSLILGLLILKSRTIYEIKEKIKSGLSLMYSNSMGSIQAAIKKLLQEGFISCSEIVENGKFKKQYSITKAGKEYFEKWINTPMRASQNKNADLSKLYFMGLSDPKTRVERIDSYIRSLQEMHDMLEVIYNEGKAMAVDQAFTDIITYQLLSVKYGMDSIQFNMEWYQKLISDIKKGVL